MHCASGQRLPHRAARKAEEPDVAGLQDACGTLEHDIAELNRRQAALRQKTSELKAQGKDIADRTAAAQYRASCAKEDVDRLQSQVVSSPSRIKAEVATAESDAVHQVSLAKAAEQAKRGAAARFQAVEAARSLVRSLQSMSTDIEAEFHKLQAAQRAAQESALAAEAAASRVHEVSAEAERLEAGVRRLQDRVSATKCSAHTRLATARKAVSAAQAEYRALMAEGEEASTRQQAGEAKQAALKAEAEAARAAHEQSLAALASEWSQVQASLRSWHKRVQAALAVAHPA